MINCSHVVARGFRPFQNLFNDAIGIFYREEGGGPDPAPRLAID